MTSCVQDLLPLSAVQYAEAYEIFNRWNVVENGSWKLLIFQEA